MRRISLPLLLILLILPMLTNAQLCFLMPEDVPEGVFFGMSFTDFSEAVDMGSLRVDESKAFRKIYYEENPSPDIKTIVYYVDNELDYRPLYEVIVQYQSNEEAWSVGRRLFGPPNFVNTENGELEEWRYAGRGVPPIWAWVYQDKLVIAAKIPQTEWDEDW